MMKANDVIREMLRVSGKSARGVSLAIGKFHTHLSTAFARDAKPRMDTFAQVAHECGFKVFVDNGETRIEVEWVEYDDHNQGTADQCRNQEATERDEHASYPAIFMREGQHSDLDSTC